MKKWKTYILMFILLSSFVAGCSYVNNNKQPHVNTGQPADKQATLGIKQGQKAPDFTLLNEQDAEIRLSQFQGKVVVINFWATWCGPCRDEMPALERFYKGNRADVVLLGVNIKEDKETIMQFMQREGYTYPVVRDTFAQVADQYQVRAIPTTYVLDQKGIIRFKKVGPVTAEELQQFVDAVKK